MNNTTTNEILDEIIQDSLEIAKHRKDCQEMIKSILNTLYEIQEELEKFGIHLHMEID